MREHAIGTHELVRCLPELECPPIVPQTLPLGKHVGTLRTRKRLNRGKALEPALPATIDT